MISPSSVFKAVIFNNFVFVKQFLFLTVKLNETAIWILFLQPSAFEQAFKKCETLYWTNSMELLAISC